MRRSALAGAALAAAAIGLACASRGAGGGRVRESRGGEVAPPPRAPGGRVPNARPAPAFAAGRVVRIALAEGVQTAQVAATGEWTVSAGDGGPVLARGAADQPWTIQRRGDELRALGPAGGTSWRRGPLVVRPTSGAAFVAYAGRRYRGELWLHPTPGGGVTVVDRLPAEDYLRGVLPLELAGEGPADHAALEAQAVAARSYTYSRLAEFLPRAAAVARANAAFDLRATVNDQVYGGVGVERAAADRAILATSHLILRFGGTVVSAPYHSACGGSTAAPDEVWGAERAPYLRAVSDAVPGTDRVYCDPAPRYRWTREWTGEELDATLRRYLRQYAERGTGPAGAIGTVRGVDLLGRTASGRIAAVAVRTDAGRFVLRGNGIRFTLRGRGGDILPSTYFSAAAEGDGAGRVTRLVLRGGGNGHGVGMCQWGAVGRSRAGQDFRAILRTYYPGTTVEPVD